MRININNNPNHTKTMKYLFGIELSMYNKKEVESAFENLNPYYLNEPWDQINVYLDDEATTDYDLKEQINSESPTFIYHVKVDTTHPDFEKYISTLKSSVNFIDCYQCGDVDCKYAIIRFKVSVNKRVKTMLESKYSEMYRKEELDNIKKNKYIQLRYKDHETKDISEPIKILAKDEECFKYICEKLKLTDEKTIAIMKQNEYDSKLKIENEIINSKLLCQEK